MAKSFEFYPPYWNSDPHLKNEEKLLQVSTAGGMLVSTHKHQQLGKWGLDCCIMQYPEEVKVFMDKTIKIYHPAPAEWKSLSRFAIAIKKLRYRFLLSKRQ